MSRSVEAVSKQCRLTLVSMVSRRVEACRSCRLSVGGRIDSLYAYGVSECRLCRVSECRACQSVSERVERVESVRCVKCSSRHNDRRRRTVVGGPPLPLSLS